MHRSLCSCPSEKVKKLINSNQLITKNINSPNSIWNCIKGTIYFWIKTISLCVLNHNPKFSYLCFQQVHLLLQCKFSVVQNQLRIRCQKWINPYKNSKLLRFFWYNCVNFRFVCKIAIRFIHCIPFQFKSLSQRNQLSFTWRFNIYGICWLSSAYSHVPLINSVFFFDVYFHFW